MCLFILNRKSAVILCHYNQTFFSSLLQHSWHTHLWPYAEKTTTVGCPTFTYSLPIAQALKVIVECELCAYKKIYICISGGRE